MLPRSRITKLVVTGILLATTMVAGASSAPAGPRCTLRGTSGDDRLIDTGGASVICALGGSDLVEGGPRPTGSSAARVAIGWKGTRAGTWCGVAEAPT